MRKQTSGQTDAEAGRAYLAAQRWRLAAQAFARAAAAEPDNPIHRFNLGGVLRTLGRLDEAMELFQALKATPLRLAALAQISALAAADLSDEELAALRADDTPASQFAAGRGLDAQGDYDGAFVAFDRGNRLQRARLELSPEAAARRHEDAIRAMREVFTADFIAHHQGGGHPSRAPIFIVGMPRSGSTLIEQILASHPEVEGMGESRVMADTVAGRFPYPLLAPSPPGYFRSQGERYLKAMRARGWKGGGRLVDKTLFNDVAVGVIHLMLPRAVVLHSVRDAADICLSAWRQLFTAGAETTYDLADIGRHYRRYRETMAHWEAVLPGRVVDIDHDRLVGDPEAGIRALVAAAGLTWDDACLAFHRSDRAVATASAIQVRRPIFTTSRERWRRYERHLGPLFEALGPYAPA